MINASDPLELLDLRARPVAIAFLDAPPAGLAPWRGAAKPAGCAFWLDAQQGASFYTVASDHFNCAIGAYTHAIDLPPDRASELEGTIRLMVEGEYLEMAEVPGIPRLDHGPAVVAYAPVDDGAFAPDVVLITATPTQAMLIYEAALRAGAGTVLTNLMGRPSCAVLPFAISSASAAVSLGCTGNRTFTGLQDDELYVAIPGAKWEDFKVCLAEIVAANEHMSRYYVEHEAAVAAAP